MRAVIGVPFSVTLQAVGGTGALTWSVTAGQLPPGLGLGSSTGLISGTPTSGWSSPFVIQVADAKTTVAKQFYFNLYTKLSLDPVTPPSAHLNAPYALSLSVELGGSGIAFWKISAGQLPPGIQLNNNLISGTPTQAGTFSFTVQIQDYTMPQTATEDFTIVVDTHLAITKWNSQGGGQNQPYTDAFTAVNGVPPYTWSATGLPSGLNLNASTGQLTGTPATFGSFNYTVTATDSSVPLQSDTQQGSMNLLQQLQIFGTLDVALLNQSYYQALNAQGGSQPYTWTITSGQLPPGIIQIGQGGGWLNGVATQLGTYNFVLQVKDSSSPGYTVSQAISLQVKPVPLQIIGVDAPPAPLGLNYHFQVPLFGGTPPFVWNVSSGQLPPGLILDASTGYIDGVPTQLGSFAFTMRATDVGSPPQVAPRNYVIAVKKPLGRNDSIATATPLGNGFWSASISPYVSPVGSSTANPDSDYYRIVAAAGSIVHAQTWPPIDYGNSPLNPVIEILDVSGKRLSTCNGTASGYESSCLNDDIDATTTDSALDLQVPGAAGTQVTFYVHVFDERGDARPDMLYQLQISGAIDPLTITIPSLGAGATRGVNYQQQFSTAGGAGTVMWSVSAGNLPSGWSLSSAGLLSGVATTDGTYSFTIQAADSGKPPQTAQTSYSLIIADPLVITTSAQLPNACVGQPYTFTVQSAGGLPPYRWGWISLSWPLTSPPSPVTTPNLVFTGTPPTAGSYTELVGINDSAQPSSGMSQNLTLNVVKCP
ncbi:MAG: hypothetical protein JWN92_2919 [Candidatus Acidoferrum typicum]|nr:hypothetical protein [Candidatus Acidoferrum typicum]